MTSFGGVHIVLMLFFVLTEQGLRGFSFDSLLTREERGSICANKVERGLVWNVLNINNRRKRIYVYINKDLGCLV